MSNICLYRYGNKKNSYIEYLAMGDISGQVTLVEVPKLFSEMKVYKDNLDFR